MKGPWVETLEKWEGSKGRDREGASCSMDWPTCGLGNFLCGGLVITHALHKDLSI